MINGIFTDVIPVRDRGLQYGDGCFETIVIRNHLPVLLPQHLSRLEHTCQQLKINYDHSALLQEFNEFLSSCNAHGIIKIIITRGIGGRGYAANHEHSGSRIIMYDPLPDGYAALARQGVSVAISDIRLSESAMLAGLKHLNRLDQVLASFNRREGVDELLCLDSAGHIIEGTKSNLVLIRHGELLTPRLNRAGVEGVMLGYLKQCFASDGKPIHCRPIPLTELASADELFLCNSVFGVWPVRKMTENATVHTWSIGPWTEQALHYQHELFQPAQ